MTPKPSKENTSKPTINTHNLIVNFGKYRGERWTRIPLSYLRWLINENSQYKEIATAEIERRGSSLTADKSVELSGHAIDKASLRLRKTWHETALDNNEGLFAWLERMAIEAYHRIDQNSDHVIYNRIKFVFMKGELYPVLKTVMPSPRVHYRQSGSMTEAQYKGAYMRLEPKNDGVVIHVAESQHPENGEVKEMIEVMRDDYPDKDFILSRNINADVVQILEEKGLAYANGADIHQPEDL